MRAVLTPCVTVQLPATVTRTGRRRLDLAGIAIWRLGGEDPESWKVIRGKLLEDPFESQRMVNQVLPEH